MLKDGLYIVTGASSGIGFSLVNRLLSLNTNVLGISRRNIDIAHSQFSQKNGDLTQIEFVEQVYNEVKSSSQTINAVIFCHGIGQFSAIEQFSAKAIEHIMAVNVNSVAFMLRRFVPILKKQNSGDIIAVGSEAALNGAKQGTMYCASKFALRGLLQSLRLECASNNVRVGLVNPGLVQTPFFDGLHFKPGDKETEHLYTQDVVHAIMTLLTLRENAVIDEINLSPMVNVIQKNQ